MVWREEGHGAPFIVAGRRTVDAVQRAPAAVRARRRPVEGAATLRAVWGTRWARRGGVARSGACGRLALPWTGLGGARRARHGAGAACSGWCWACCGCERGPGGEGERRGAWHGRARCCHLRCRATWRRACCRGCRRRLHGDSGHRLTPSGVQRGRGEEGSAGLAPICPMHNPKLGLIHELLRFGKNRVGDHKVFVEMFEPKQYEICYLIFHISLNPFGFKLRV